ncbi:MAG: hypothetical protein AAF639_45865 [Chloroflexota bacterium]
MAVLEKIIQENITVEAAPEDLQVDVRKRTAATPTKVIGSPPFFS